jgi:O-antigen ligase
MTLVGRHPELGAPAESLQLRPTRLAGRAKQKTRLGFMFSLALVWTLFEFGRPPTPPLLLLLISGVMFSWWLTQKGKRLGKDDAWWFALLAVTATGVVLSANNYSAFMSLRFFLVLFLGVCLPLQALVSTPARVRAWIYMFVVTSTYVGAWALTHGGYGPAGSDGHDENYVAAIVVTGAALAYFSMIAEKRAVVRVLLMGSILVSVAALAVANNPSRGGFLALCVVTAYAVYRSPHKLVTIGAIAIGGITLLAFAGDAFWAEISTSADYTSGTGDMRLELWKAGLRMWQDSPLLGVGAGNFRWRVGDFQTAVQFEKFGRDLGGSVIAHSMPIELLAELGSVGVLATAMLVRRAWRGLGKVLLVPPMFSKGRLPRELFVLRCYADAMRAAMLSVLVNGVFLSLLYYSHLWVLVAVSTALFHVHQRTVERLRGTTAVADGARR